MLCCHSRVPAALPVLLLLLLLPALHHGGTGGKSDYAFAHLDRSDGAVRSAAGGYVNVPRPGFGAGPAGPAAPAEYDRLDRPSTSVKAGGQPAAARCAQPSRLGAWTPWHAAVACGKLLWGASPSAARIGLS